MTRTMLLLVVGKEVLSNSSNNTHSLRGLSTIIAITTRNRRRKRMVATMR